MKRDQLKHLAYHLRHLLKKAGHIVNHIQSLDLVAAVPGFKDWLEVNAAARAGIACELDIAAATRLAERLKIHFDLDLPVEDLQTWLLTAQKSPRWHQSVGEMWNFDEGGAT